MRLWVVEKRTDFEGLCDYSIHAKSDDAEKRARVEQVAIEKRWRQLCARENRSFKHFCDSEGHPSDVGMFDPSTPDSTCQVVEKEVEGEPVFTAAEIMRMVSETFHVRHDRMYSGLQVYELLEDRLKKGGTK